MYLHGDGKPPRKTSLSLPGLVFSDCICDSTRVGQEANDLLNLAFHRVNGVFCLRRQEKICF